MRCFHSQRLDEVSPLQIVSLKSELSHLIFSVGTPAVLSCLSFIYCDAWVHICSYEIPPNSDAFCFCRHCRRTLTGFVRLRALRWRSRTWRRGLEFRSSCSLFSVCSWKSLEKVLEICSLDDGSHWLIMPRLIEAYLEILYRIYVFYKNHHITVWPRGLMVKALVFGTKDCAFESHRGRMLLFLVFVCHQPRFHLPCLSYGLIRVSISALHPRLHTYVSTARWLIWALWASLSILENVGFPTRKPRAASFAVQPKYLLGPRAPIRWDCRSQVRTITRVIWCGRIWHLQIYKLPMARQP